MPRIRAVTRPPGPQAVARHVRGLQEAGRRVLLVSVERPYRDLSAALAEAGALDHGLLLLDAVTATTGHAPVPAPPGTAFLPSPTMLEMMAVRLEQLLPPLETAGHVVVDSLSTLALYNGALPAQEFARYLAARLRTHGTPCDFLVRDDAAGQAMQRRVADFMDACVHVGAEETP